jgi:hypothetical protein
VEGRGRKWGEKRVRAAPASTGVVRAPVCLLFGRRSSELEWGKLGTRPKPKVDLGSWRKCKNKNLRCEIKTFWQAFFPLSMHEIQHMRCVCLLQTPNLFDTCSNLKYL